MPLSFAPGEAYRFDWSHEVVLLNGATVTVKVAHVRLCHSRILFVRAYARNEQEVEHGVRTIAVPIRERPGEILASLSMSAPVGDFDREGLIKLLPELEVARGRIESAVCSY